MQTYTPSFKPAMCKNDKKGALCDFYRIILRNHMDRKNMINTG